MGLFSKNNNDKELIETMGPIPEGYHSVKLIMNGASSSGGSIELQQKVVKMLRKQCVAEKLDGFANLRFTSSGHGSWDNVFGAADGIKHD